MENQEIHCLRDLLEQSRKENAFLRTALAHAIGDGMLILPNEALTSARFNVNSSTDALCITVKQ